MPEILGPTIKRRIPEKKRPIIKRIAHTSVIAPNGAGYEVEAIRTEEGKPLLQRLKVFPTLVEVSLNGAPDSLRQVNGHNPNQTTVYARTMRSATRKGFHEILKQKIAAKKTNQPGKG